MGIDITDKSKTLCWDCSKAIKSGCSWSAEFIPVPGWTATKTKLKLKQNDSSYIVHECPEFDRDMWGYGRYRTEEEEIEAITKSNERRQKLEQLKHHW